MGEKLHYRKNTRPRRWIQGQKNIFGPNAPPPPGHNFMGTSKLNILIFLELYLPLESLCKL